MDNKTILVLITVNTTSLQWQLVQKTFLLPTTIMTFVVIVVIVSTLVFFSDAELD